MSLVPVVEELQWNRFKLFQFVFVFVTALANQFSSFIKGSTSVCGQNGQNLLFTSVYILTANRSTALNKRTELVNKCRHKNKYKLKQFKPIP